MSTKADYVAEVKQAKFPTVGSIGFAVFNVREYEKRKAREEFIAEFGREAFDRAIRPILNEGIMSIFHQSPTQETAFYALAIARRVERRVAKKKAVNA